MKNEIHTNFRDGDNILIKIFIGWEDLTTKIRNEERETRKKNSTWWLSSRVVDLVL